MSESVFKGEDGSRARRALQNFESALTRMHEAEGLVETTIVRDALIRRFVNAFETAWRTLYWLLTVRGVQVRPEPTHVLQRSLEMHLLKDEALWSEIRRFRDRSPQASDDTRASELTAFLRSQAIRGFDHLLLEMRASDRFA